MTSKPPLERDLGEQPIAKIMQQHELKAQDLVAASTEQITHKMVARAMKGRRLSGKVKLKIRTALNLCAGQDYSMNDLFNY